MALTLRLKKRTSSRKKYKMRSHGRIKAVVTEVVIKKDNFTVQKYQFSNRHCSNLLLELQAVLPSFTCPAFVAMHDSCRSAKYVSSPPPPPLPVIIP